MKMINITKVKQITNITIPIIKITFKVILIPKIKLIINNPHISLYKYFLISLYLKYKTYHHHHN